VPTPVVEIFSGLVTTSVGESLELAGKLKGPELGISGPALRGVGGGRGLTARDAVCVDLRIAISDLFVYYFGKYFPIFFGVASRCTGQEDDPGRHSRSISLKTQ